MLATQAAGAGTLVDCLNHGTMPAEAQEGAQKKEEATELARARLADAEVLREQTGRAPTPWWWPQPDPKGPKRPGRPASAHHEAFARAALDPSSIDPSSRPVYVHWLYAKCLGYQGFSIPLSFGQLALTTPHPTREIHAKAITAKGLDQDSQEGLFSEFVGQLSFEKVLRAIELELAPVEEKSNSKKKANKGAHLLTPGGNKRKSKVSWKPMKYAERSLSPSP